jgi:hypothetical protein
MIMKNSVDRQHRSLLQKIARRVMLERGLLPDFSPQAIAELDGIHGVATNADEEMRNAIEITAMVVFDSIMTPMAGISNISEWCKKEACWDRLQLKSSELKSLLPKSFFNGLVDKDDIVDEVMSAARVQKIDNGIEAQKKVISIPSAKWRQIMADGNKKNLFSPMEVGILQVASQIPAKIPSEKQSVILIKILAKATSEGIN